EVAAGQAGGGLAAGGGVERCGGVGGEGHHVMIERAFEFLAALQAKGRFGLYRFKIRFRHEALANQGFAGEQFDLEPDLELALLAPDFPHRWAGVALNHARRVEGRAARVEYLGADEFPGPRPLMSADGLTAGASWRGPLRGCCASGRSWCGCPARKPWRVAG